MTRRGRLFALPVAFAAACQPGAGTAPPATTPSPASDPPPVEVRRVPFSFGGPLFQPDATLRIRAGTGLVVPVMTNLQGLGGDGEGVSILVRTDAPPEALLVPPAVSVVGSAEPGLVEIRAPGEVSRGEPTETYRIWLEADPGIRWAAGWEPQVDETAVHVAVDAAPAAPPRCERLQFTARVHPDARDGGERARLTFGSIADDFRAGTITLVADHPETSLTLLSRYRMPYADLDPESDRARVRFHLYPTSFAFGLGLRETPGGFEHTMSLGWFDEMHFRAEAPGCDAVELFCDDRGRCSSWSPAP